MGTTRKSGLRAAAEAVGIDAPRPAEPVQLDAFAAVTPDQPGALVAGETPRGPGRPKGAANRSTRAWADYLIGRHGHPLEEIAAAGKSLGGWITFLRRVAAEQGMVFNMGFAECVAEWRQARLMLASFTLSKLAPELPHTEDPLRPVVVMYDMRDGGAAVPTDDGVLVLNADEIEQYQQLRREAVDVSKDGDVESAKNAQ